MQLPRRMSRANKRSKLNPVVTMTRYTGRMSSSSLARYLNPRKFRREEHERKVASLRHRDGDHCTRCRRPVRFDLPAGHDLSPKIELVGGGEADTIEHSCLTHTRCNAQAGDNTEEVQERVRRKSEAALFNEARTKRRA